MKRIRYDVPRWYTYLHRHARKLPFADGLDSRQRRLEDELFAQLYAGNLDALKDPDPQDAEWAKGVLSQLGDLAQAEKACRGNATLAAEATQKIIESLPQNAQPAAGNARDAAAGLSGVQMGNQPWTGQWQGDAAEEKRARDLAERLRNDDRLKRIALLAGKFQRIALSKQKVKVRRGADEIADVGQGDAIDRLLPTELVRFASRRHRLAAIRDLVERRCLQYEMESTEELGRGPVILCLDKSPSMEGEKDIWATAVALALMEAAHRERRTFVLLCFADDVFYRKVVKPGRPMPESALFVPLRGGTDVGRVLDLALSAVESRSTRWTDREGRMRDPVFRRADVVVVTDGESGVHTAPSLRARAAARSVKVLGVGIGVPVSNLAPWCTEAISVEDVSKVEDAAAGTIFSV